MASRNINDLRQDVHEMALKHVALCTAKGITLLIYCTLRSNAEQTELYKIGRTLPGKKVTNARAGESKHNPDKNNKSSAYDAVPLLYGKPIWDSKDPVWAIVGALGESVGLVWSGRWQGSIRETAHWEAP